MDRRPIRQIFAQIISELFLRAAADRDDHMRRAMLFNQRKKILIFDFRTVPRRDITILARRSEMLRGATNRIIFVARVRWEEPRKLLCSPRLSTLPSRCFRYLRPEMRWTFCRRNKRHRPTIKPLSAIARSAASTARRYDSSSRNRAKQVPDGATRNPPCRDINATASSTSPLKNRMPRICRPEAINKRRTSNIERRISRARSGPSGPASVVKTSTRIR